MKARPERRGGESSLRQQFLGGNAAQLKQPVNYVFDEVVWARRAGGDADGDFAGRQPVTGLGFLFGVLVVMADEFVRLHFGGVFDEVSWQLGLAHFGEV